ncbi:GH25 family lysozyme [Mycobacterium colombiense]|nr:GH25 family lysozyme [Mycobacterium colombiense]
MTVLQSSINWVITNFEERLGDPYVYGGVYSNGNVRQGCDCSGCAGWVLEALTKTPANMSWAHNVSTESWPYDYNTNTPAAPGTVGPYGTISVGSNPAALPADAALWVNIMHGGGGEDSHMNTMLPNGFIMESNGDDGTCTNGTGGADQNNPEWTDHWYLPGPVTADVTPVTPVTPPPVTPVLFGIDISNNNFGGPTSPNLGAIPGFVAEVVKEGFSWIEAKASEGSTFADPTFPAIYQACLANDIPVVAYHYVDTSNPDSQASNCKAALNGADVGIMLDWETNGGDFSNYEAVWHAFTNAGLTIVLEYIPQWYWESQGSPDLSAVSVKGMVSSNWVNGSGYAYNLYPGDSWGGWASYGGVTPVILQFTSQAQVAGMSLDADAFRGSLADLKALLGTTPSQGDDPLMALSSAQQEDMYNMLLFLTQSVTGDLNPSITQFLLPGSPTPVGADWGTQPNVGDQIATVAKAVADLTTAVTALSADFATTSTGLAVLQKLADLNSILQGTK